MEWIIRLKSGWNALKVLRVALGIIILAGGIENREAGNIVFGSFFLLLALFTDGVCCGSGSCSIPPRKNTAEIKSYTDEKVDA